MAGRGAASWRPTAPASRRCGTVPGRSAAPGRTEASAPPGGRWPGALGLRWNKGQSCTVAKAMAFAMAAVTALPPLRAGTGNAPRFPRPRATVPRKPEGPGTPQASARPGGCEAPAGGGPRISRAPGQGRWPLPSGARRARVQVFPALRSARPCGGTFGCLPEAGMPTLPGRLPRHPARRRWLPLIARSAARPLHQPNRAGSSAATVGASSAGGRPATRSATSADAEGAV